MKRHETTDTFVISIVDKDGKTRKHNLGLGALQNDKLLLSFLRSVSMRDITFDEMDRIRQDAVPITINQN